MLERFSRASLLSDGWTRRLGVPSTSSPYLPCMGPFGAKSLFMVLDPQRQTLVQPIGRHLLDGHSRAELILLRSITLHGQKLITWPLGHAGNFDARISLSVAWFYIRTRRRKFFCSPSSWLVIRWRLGAVQDSAATKALCRWPNYQPHQKLGAIEGLCGHQAAAAPPLERAGKPLMRLRQQAARSPGAAWTFQLDPENHPQLEAGRCGCNSCPATTAPAQWGLSSIPSRACRRSPGSKRPDGPQPLFWWRGRLNPSTALGSGPVQLALDCSRPGRLPGDPIGHGCACWPQP